MYKIVKILEFGDIIWNHPEKFIQISTNMPGIGLVNHGKALKFESFMKTKSMLHDKTNMLKGITLHVVYDTWRVGVRVTCTVYFKEI